MRLSGVIPGNIPGNSGKIASDVIMTSRDVTWSDFHENFRKSFFRLYEHTVKISSQSDAPNES